MHTRIVILAAGKGKRMKSELPKVLVSLRGNPLIKHVLASVEASHIDPEPLVVIGNGGDRVRSTLGNQYDYVEQKEQLGTGHAVATALASMPSSCEALIVLYGDQPFVTPLTIQRLANIQNAEKPALVMTTVTVSDFDGPRQAFYDFGRVIRNEQNAIAGIVERKDANDTELNIRELNASFFSFSVPWLKTHIGKLSNKNAQGEYYLTDLVGIAVHEKAHIASVDINPLESIGINTREHLEAIERL